MKQKIIKRLKLVIIVICILLMIICICRTNFGIVYGSFYSYLSDVVWEKNKSEQVISLIIKPHKSAEKLDITYDAGKIKCRDLPHSMEEGIYRKWFVKKDYLVAHTHDETLSGDGYAVFLKETYVVYLFENKKLEIESDKEFNVEIHIGNYLQKTSNDVINIDFSNEIKQAKIEVEDNGILIISENDLSDSSVELSMQNPRRTIEYDIVNLQDDKEIYSMYIQMISETECKVFLDLDNDGEFEYECVGEEREW